MTTMFPHQNPPIAQGGLQPYLSSISDIPLLTPKEERALFAEIAEQRQILTEAAFSVPEICSKGLEIFQHLHTSSKDPRNYLEFGKREATAVRKKLASHVPLLRDLTTRKQRVRLESEKVRIEKKIGILAYELRLKDKILHGLITDHLKTHDNPTLSHALQEAIALRNKAMEYNLRLVISIAKRHPKKGCLLDAIQGGNTGLMRAVERFEPKLGYRFSTYATPWIRQGIQNTMKTAGKIIDEPGYLNEVRNDIERARDALRQEGAPETEAAEIHSWLRRNPSPKAKVASEKIIAAALTERKQLSLSDLTLPSYTPPPTLDEVLGIDIDVLHQALATLPERERYVIKKRFALAIDGTTHAEQTLEDVGNELGISKERVRQLQNKGLQKLREHLRRRIIP
jgi:RNA polymerase sigma factor (sigma-70 family)